MRRIAIVLFDGFHILNLAAPAAFELVAREAGAPDYAVEFVSEAGGSVMSSIGMLVETKPLGNQPFDTLIVVGTLRPEPVGMPLISLLTEASRDTRRIASTCTGSFVLAQAGLLNGRRATTHWAHARAFRDLYPDVVLEEDRIFTKDGAFWTSAGMTAGIDLALALIEDDFGAEVSRSVARSLVVYHRRAGGQSQFSALLELEPKSDRIQRSLTYAKAHLTRELAVDELADAAGLSPRQFSRVFRSETGQTPAKAVEILRLEAARVMLETSRHPVEIVARESGFADGERMRRAFMRVVGQPPLAIRRSGYREHGA